MDGVELRGTGAAAKRHGSRAAVVGLDPGAREHCMVWRVVRDQ